MKNACFFAGIVAAGLATSVGLGQTSTPAPPTAAPTASTASSTPKHKHAKQTQAIPRETAPPTASTSPDAVVETPEERAADQRLLQEQQAQSAKAAAINTKEVKQYDQQQQTVQNEVRIQDAPGPAQTGVVPAAGVPVAPVNADQRNQDAPGPAQTLPTLPKTVPAQQNSAQTPVQAPEQTTPAAPAQTTPPQD